MRARRASPAWTEEELAGAIAAGVDYLGRLRAEGRGRQQRHAAHRAGEERHNWSALIAARVEDVRRYNGLARAARLAREGEERAMRGLDGEIDAVLCILARWEERRART